MAEEKQFETRIKHYLESVGIYPLGHPCQKMTVPPVGYYVKRWGGGKFTKAGLPDMQIVVNGKCVDVELKATNGRPSELQLHIIKQINNSGGCALLVYPKDFSYLQKIIEKEIHNNDC